MLPSSINLLNFLIDPEKPPLNFSTTTKNLGTWKSLVKHQQNPQNPQQLSSSYQKALNFHFPISKARAPKLSSLIADQER